MLFQSDTCSLHVPHAKCQWAQIQSLTNFNLPCCKGFKSLAAIPQRRLGTDGGKTRHLVPRLSHTAVNQDTHMLGACHASLFPCSMRQTICRKGIVNVATDSSFSVGLRAPVSFALNAMLFQSDTCSLHVPHAKCQWAQIQ